MQGRGRFYDETGAIRDVVQNHLLQVVGMLAMEPPSAMYHEAVRDEHVKVLRSIQPVDPAHLVRGQFDGYRQEPGVAPDSDVETYAALAARGRLVALGGRAVADSRRQESAGHGDRSPGSLQSTAADPHLPRLRPTTCASDSAPRSRSGSVRARSDWDFTRRPHPVELSVVEHPHGDEVDAYERLLSDAMAGERLLFVREDAVDAAWAVVEPILDHEVPVHAYTPGTWGPSAAERLVSDVGGWHNPI